MIRYIRGYDLIASDADSARTYYHYASDELGSITHVAAGEDILNRYEYDAWGNLTFCEETVENRFKFNGQQYDPISQQYYLRARYYNPVIGRFTQEDTYRGDGLNLYAYCRNNPVYYADPSGHFTNCFKEAYLRYIDEGLSREDAYKAAKRDFGIGVDSLSSLTPNDDISTRADYEERRREQRSIIREYEQAANIDGGLPETQRQALIEAGMRGAVLEHVTQQKSGIETIVAYNGESGQIYFQAGTITAAGISNGTGTTDASRRYARETAQEAGYTSPVDYGHLIGRNEGGGGGINDRNGFPQNASINRGEFRIFQAEINSVARSQDVHVFSQLIYANNNAMPTSLFYSTDISGEFERSNFKN